MNYIKSLDNSFDISLKDIIDWLIDPKEAPISPQGLASQAQVSRYIAAKLMKHPNFEKYGHIEQRINLRSGEKEFWLWRYKEWFDESAVRALRKKKIDLKCHEVIQKERRIQKCLDRIIRVNPNLKRNYGIVVQLVNIQLNDYHHHEPARGFLEKYGFFDSVDADAQEIEEMKSDLMKFIESQEINLKETNFNEEKENEE